MAHNKDDLYLAKNAGNVRRYKITRPKAKHFRDEFESGEIHLVCYGALDPNNPLIRDTIMLTPEDAETKYRHMGLLPFGRDRVEINAPKRGRPSKIVDDGEVTG